MKGVPQRVLGSASYQVGKMDVLNVSDSTSTSYTYSTWLCRKSCKLLVWFIGRELQLCSSSFCSVTITWLEPMSRMRGMLFSLLPDAYIYVHMTLLDLPFCFFERADFYSAFTHWWVVDCRVPRPRWPSQKQCWWPLARALRLCRTKSNCGGCGLQ